MRKDPLVEAREEPVEDRVQNVVKEKIKTPPVKEYVPRLPYRSRLKKDQVNKQFKRFLGLLK